MAGPCLDEKGGVAAIAKIIVEDKTTAAEVDFIYLASWTRGALLDRAAGFAGAAFRLLWLCARGRIDVLHLHTASRGSFLRKYVLSRIARLFDIPYIVHLHGGGFHDFYRETPLKKQVLAYFRRASSVIVLGEWWRQWVSITIGGVSGITIVRNGVPSALSLDPSGKVDSISDVTRLLFLGRLGKLKGLVDLTHALAVLRAEHPEIRFSLVVGGDGDWQPFQKLVDSLGLQGCVRYVGWVEGAEKTRLIDSASVFVLPSYKEGMPVAVVESMARGLPVISTAVGSIPEVLEDGKEGWIIRPGDGVALKEALLMAATDQALLREMQINAFKKYKRTLNLETQMEELLMVYRRLLSIPTSVK